MGAPLLAFARKDVNAVGEHVRVRLAEQPAIEAAERPQHPAGGDIDGPAQWSRRHHPYQLEQHDEQCRCRAGTYAGRHDVEP